MTIQQYFKVEKFKTTMALGKLNKKIDTYIVKNKAIPKKLQAQHRELVETINALA